MNPSDLAPLREAPLSTALSRWRFGGSVEVADAAAAAAAAAPEQLGMCCSDADGVITCIWQKRSR